ncbi:MAG TPA: c-type cytochrome [Terriglobia bacterium]|nr:c-type cytochrome [Terriglobia bacterium]
MFLLVSSLLALLASSGPVWANGNRDAGLRLARQWCSGCHAVDDAATQADATASFRNIARTHGTDKAWLRQWLTSSHPSMPNVNLSAQEVDDIAAYLASLSG